MLKITARSCMAHFYSIEWVMRLYMLCVYLCDKRRFIQYKYILHFTWVKVFLCMHPLHNKYSLSLK